METGFYCFDLNALVGGDKVSSLAVLVPSGTIHFYDYILVIFKCLNVCFNKESFFSSPFLMCKNLQLFTFTRCFCFQYVSKFTKQMVKE